MMSKPDHTGSSQQRKPSRFVSAEAPVGASAAAPADPRPTDTPRAGVHRQPTTDASAGSVRFVHTSDWHVGLSRHFLDGEAQARYTAARIDAIRSIGDLADREGCSFVLVAGDVFDSNLCPGQTVRRALEAMRSIRCPVYLLPGNHDALNAVTVYRSRDFQDAKPDHVHVLDTPGPFPVACGVELVAAPLLTNAPLIDVVGDAVADLPASRMRRILVGHGVAESAAPIEGNRAAIRLAPLEQAVRSGVVDYVALGDRHTRLAIGSTGRIHYSGAPEVTSFGDAGPGEALVVELPPNGGPAVRPHRIGSWRFVEVRRHVDTAADVDDLDADLTALDPKDRTVVRTALAGTLSLSLHARLEEVLERHGQLLAGLFPWERHTDLAVMVDGSELSDLGIGGFVDAAVAELVSCAADDPDRAEAARDALSLLYRLAVGSPR